MALLILLAIFIEAVLIAIINHYDNVVLKLLAQAKEAAHVAGGKHD